MNREAEVQDIKENVLQISHKLDELINEKDVIAGMKLSEQALAPFLDEEPDLYTIKDARVVYH
ncbi:MAG: hypothetical protein WC015_10140 [Methanoregula sp.]|jgi:hypothetical protein